MPCVFEQLRTQALASLHSALQKNQGVPVSQVVKWLAMEGEDMEALLTYHGFSLKSYEEQYMVKEGPFQNRDNDCPTKRSQLVYNKRSSRVFDDVISSGQLPIIHGTFSTVKATDSNTDRLINMHKATDTPVVTAILPSDEEMPDYEDELQPPKCEVKEEKINQQFGDSLDKQMPSLKEASEVPNLTVAPPDKRMPLAKGACEVPILQQDKGMTSTKGAGEVPILTVAPQDKRMPSAKEACEVPILTVAPQDRGTISDKEACEVPILTVAQPDKRMLSVKGACEVPILTETLLDKDMPSVKEACKMPIPTMTPPDTDMHSAKEACEAPTTAMKPTFGVQNINELFKAEMTDVISKNNFQHKEQPSNKRKNYFSPERDRQHKKRIGGVEEESMSAENNYSMPKSFSCNDQEENVVARDTSQYLIADFKRREEEETLALYWKEIQLIRLKLLLRRWKRQAAKKRTERHMNDFKSGYALSSLCLGPPVQPNKLVSQGEQLTPKQPVPVKALTWEQIFRERQSRHEKMWMKLELPELIAPILCEKNPQAKCLCWKLILCSRNSDNEGHHEQRHSHTSNTASQWLLAKLFGNGKTNDKALISSPDMIIMQKQLNIVGKQNGSHDLCFLSILRDLSFNMESVEREDACLGASGIIFLLLEDVQWDVERARLQSLVNTIPSGSKLPLLIISSKNCEESMPQNQQLIGSMHAKIERELVLCLDRTKIGSLSIISITENEAGGARGGFFSDGRLRDGLLWLASQAPVQPIVYPSDLRGLVQKYLNNYLAVLLNMKPSEVIPNNCINAFNESLDRTAHDISNAAQNSHPHWPPPEISLLDKTTENRIPVNSLLPQSGWNIASNIYSILQVLQVYRLPHFPAVNSNNIFCGTREHGVSSSGLNPRRTECSEIHELKTYFKKLLYDYLTQIGFIKENDMMSLKEADIMLQKGAVLEHSGLRYAIVPKWVTMFQRIFSWRLMLLASESPLVIYVLEPNNTPSVHQVFLGSSYATHQGPSLDEMIQLSIPCNPTVTPNNPMVGDESMENLNKCNQESIAEAWDRHLLEKENYSRHIYDIEQEKISSSERFSDIGVSPTSIEFPRTEGELRLDDIVKKYCEKVDEQMECTQLVAIQANASMHPAILDEARSHIDENLFPTQVADKSCTEINNGSQDLPSDSASITTIKPSWVTENGMETLNRLVEQCDNVQRTIDYKLRDFSSGKNDSNLNK